MQAFEHVEALDKEASLLLLCDHASAALPPGYGTLGLDAGLLESHIAYDIGAAVVTHRLAAHFGAAAVLGRWSRLLLDLNRGAQDPQIMPKESGGHPIPGNQGAGPDELEYRLRHYCRPYDAAIGRELDRIGPSAAVISVHSYAPTGKDGAPSPWEVGVVWGEDRRLSDPLMGRLAEHGFVVGKNQPFAGALKGDCLCRNVTCRGIPSVLIEIRQDLLATERMAMSFADRLHPVLAAALADMKQAREGV